MNQFINKSDHKKKILITGGHATCAMAVAEELIAKGFDIEYVGRKYALEGDTAVSFEYNLVHSRNIPFHVLETGRLQRHLSREFLSSLIKVPAGFLRAQRLLKKIRPSCILSFGGYVALPVALVGAMMRIPVVTHEQTMRPGLTNRIISRFAKRLYISWPGSDTLFAVSSSKMLLTGNPIRKSVQKVIKKLSFPDQLPLLYITGGSLGAQTINGAIAQIIPQLVEQFNVIHQTGSANNNRDFEILRKIAITLPDHLAKRYQVMTHVDEDTIGWIFQTASVIVSRAGANTVSEIIATSKPSVLLPLAWSGGGEQIAHATYLSEKNAAHIILHKDLTTELLLDHIVDAYEKREEFTSNLTDISKTLPADAASAIADDIENLV